MRPAAPIIISLLAIALFLSHRFLAPDDSNAGEIHTVPTALATDGSTLLTEYADDSFLQRVVAEFDGRTESWVGDPPYLRDTNLGEWESAAAQRRAWMLRQIQDAPALALSHAVPRGWRVQLPASILAQIEQPVEGLARVEPDGQGGWFVTVNGVRYFGHFVSGPPTRPDAEMPVHGFALDGHLAVAPTPWRRIEPGEPGHRDDLIQISFGGQRLEFPDEQALQTWAEK